MPYAKRRQLYCHAAQGLLGQPWVANRRADFVRHPALQQQSKAFKGHCPGTGCSRHSMIAVEGGLHIHANPIQKGKDLGQVAGQWPRRMETHPVPHGPNLPNRFRQPFV
jgi:hypothetical protein